MSEPKVVVYAGPTLSAAGVHEILPDAVVRSPAARADILAGDWHRGDTAVVIDGYFREQRSVGHKELLWLLGQGVEVIGAASMGALRAMELAPYGMRGVGEIYRMFASGEVDGDDEVGVLHGPAELGYPAQTVALVNLRYGCRQGAADGLIPTSVGERIVAAAKALPFIFRSWPDLAERLGEDCQAALRTLRALIGSGTWDLKRLDALTALEEVRQRGAAAGLAGATVPEQPADGVALTRIGDGQLLSRRSRREYAPGRWMSDLDVLNAGRLFDPDYPRIHEEVLTGLLTELAAARHMPLQAFALVRLGVDEHSPLPDSLAAWLTEVELARLLPAERARLVITRVWPVWQSADWRPSVIARVKESDRWQRWADLVAGADEAAQAAGSRLVTPPAALGGKLFLRHWLTHGTSAEIEMARRGFLTLEELGGVARRFFAFDLRKGKDDRRQLSP